MNKKHLHIAEALPGTGKTQKFIETLPAILKSEKKVIYAAPTLALVDELMIRLNEADISAIRIDSNVAKNCKRQLDLALRSDSPAKIIVCQHASIADCSLKHLNDWTLVIDETPAVLDLMTCTFEQEQLKSLTMLEVQDGQIKIKKGKKSDVKKEVDRSSAVNSYDKAKSISSADVINIYKFLLNEGTVFIARANLKGLRQVCAIRESRIFERILKAQETHIMSAPFPGGLFDFFAKVNNLEYKRSYFTPEKRHTLSKVTIYPMLDNSLSSLRPLQHRNILNPEQQLKIWSSQLRQLQKAKPA